MNIKELTLAIKVAEDHLEHLLEEEAGVQKVIVEILCDLDDMKIELAGRT